MPDQESIRGQLNLLDTLRKRLRIQINQQKTLGAHAPAYMQLEIDNAQEQIRKIKAYLLRNGVHVEHLAEDGEEETSEIHTASGQAQPTNPVAASQLENDASDLADVFISYHPADKAWVRQTLLPLLEQQNGLRAIVDWRDFEIGVPKVMNVEKAVMGSRSTLIVLTSEWVQSEWNAFQELLASTADPSGVQRKLLPVMLRACTPPPRIAMRDIADLTDPDERDEQLQRLMRSLKRSQSKGSRLTDAGGETQLPLPSELAPASKTDDLPEYDVTKQPWYIQSLPPLQRVTQAEAKPWFGNMPVLLLTVNENEFFAVGRLLQPLPEQNRILQVAFGNETYYLGRYGTYNTVLTKTQMGSVGLGATMLATQHAQDIWKPKATIAVGVAFGMNRQKQQIGDVLIAKEIIPYNPIRAGATIIERGQRLASDAGLFNRFEHTYDWRFERPDGPLCRLHKGTIISGEELVDSAERKATLLQRFPEAIGGEMEGTGLSAASFYDRRPWILIKAICDWADGAKHGKHQPLAAAAAASLVHHVLSDPDALHNI
ncbi:MAG: TIR domain-containing protein [Chloroflexi bacterium SZAS-1]|nr:TIR domain-containing protein [Chloroflexi bacterium SZAS-1]